MLQYMDIHMQKIKDSKHRPYISIQNMSDLNMGENLDSLEFDNDLTTPKAYDPWKKEMIKLSSLK